MKIETVETKAQPFLYLTRTTRADSDAIGPAMGAAMGDIMAFMGKSGIAPAGPPVAVYRAPPGKDITFDIGFPVAKPVKPTGAIQAGEIPAGKAIKVVHRGPYAKLKDTYAELDKELKARGKAMRGVAWEVYLNMPGQVPEADLLTEVYMQY